MEENELTVIPRGGAVFLDLDNTLVHSMEPAELPQPTTKRFAKYLLSAPRVAGYVVCVRPGAKRFVDALHQVGEVFILSMGTQDYVDDVQRTIGFQVKRAWSARGLPPGSLGKGCQLYRDGDQVRPFVLVDNLDFSHSFTKIKLNVLGFNFFGEDPNSVFQLASEWECCPNSMPQGTTPVTLASMMAAQSKILIVGELTLTAHVGNGGGGSRRDGISRRLRCC